MTNPKAPAPANRAEASVKPVARIGNVNITFYDCYGQGFCGDMSNGKRVHEGAAACSYDLAEGTKFRIVGDPTRRIYRCNDRGLLANTWVDIFFFEPDDGWRWQSNVGRCGTVEIVVDSR